MITFRAIMQIVIESNLKDWWAQADKERLISIQSLASKQFKKKGKTEGKRPQWNQQSIWSEVKKVKTMNVHVAKNIQFLLIHTFLH